LSNCGIRQYFVYAINYYYRLLALAETNHLFLSLSNYQAGVERQTRWKPVVSDRWRHIKADNYRDLTSDETGIVELGKIVKGPRTLRLGWWETGYTSESVFA
jgi:hypothetical protein